MMDTGKRRGRGSFTFKIEHNDNGTFVASIIHDNKKAVSDDTGALYYVVVVILIYGCSILMMIASYIRKNNTDRKLTRYLKEMASVRKREQQLQLFNAAAKAAAQTRKSMCMEGGEHSEAELKWSGASHWSELNETLIEEGSRRGRLKSTISTSSLGDEYSRRLSDRSDIDGDNQTQMTISTGEDHLLNPHRKLRPSVRIVCDLESDTFLTDDQDDTSCGKITLKTHINQGSISPTSVGLSGQQGSLSPSSIGLSGQQGSLSSTSVGLSGQQGSISPASVGLSDQQGSISPTSLGLSGQQGSISPLSIGLSGQQGSISPASVGLSGGDDTEDETQELLSGFDSADAQIDDSECEAFIQRRESTSSETLEWSGFQVVSSV